MKLWDHTFRKHGSVERMCPRCGYVIGHDWTEEETKAWIIHEEGCELHCGGEWHQFKRIRKRT